MSSAGERRILAGRYRLEEVIGRGGMSTVYRATDLALDRIVAVKVALDPLAEENPVYVARFKREARAAAALSDPGVVTVFDAGADGPTRYIVMEYVEGRSLAEILRDDGPLEPAHAARVAAEIAGTLHVAHAAGIIHRDVKPGNVMLAPGDRVKVLDFGIARTPDAVTLTQTASVLGTAPYMAPEQAMGQPADARSDMYSLGCVLYEMLTGRPPFMAEVPAAVLHQHVRVAPKPPSEVKSGIPPALDALVLELLAKDPRTRVQTAAEVRDRLIGLETEPGAGPATAPQAGPPTEPTRRLPPAEPIAVMAAAADVPQVATVPQPASAPPGAPVRQPGAARPGEPNAPTRATPPRRHRGRGPWAFLAVAALLLLGAAVAYAVATGGSSSESTSTPPGSSTPATGSSGAATSHSTSTPTTSTSHSTSTSTSTPSTSTTTSSTSTSTTTATSTPTGPAPPGGTPPPPPPGHGGTPPGQAKKK